MESVMSGLAPMDREDLIRTILSLDCNFPVDLTEDYLHALSMERLRHICTALRLHEKPSSRAGSRRPCASQSGKPAAE